MTTATVWSEVLKWIILGVVVFLLLGQSDAIVNLRRRLPGANRRLQIGAAAPGLQIEGDIAPHSVRLEDILRLGHPAMVVFLSPTCLSCKRLVPGLNALADEVGAVDFIGVIGTGNGYDFEANLSRAIHMVLDADGRWQRDFEAAIFPHATAIDRNGRIAAQGTEDLVGIRKMLASLAAQGANNGNGNGNGTRSTKGRKRS